MTASLLAPAQPLLEAPTETLLIDAVLAPGLVAAECLGDDEGVWLYPEELRHIAHAVQKRRAEFRTVRGCAGRALARLGLARPPQVPGDRGSPAWPAGVVGSMTHCAGYRAAVVARRRTLVTVGVDAEPNLALPAGLLNEIALASELSALGRLAAAQPGVSWDRLLFSAKESVYKAWYPVERTWLGFEDAELTFTPRGAFVARLLRGGLHTGGQRLGLLMGRWAVRGGMLLTRVSVPVR